MTTICSYCGKEINEENEVNKGKKYLLCKCGAYIPKGAHSYQGQIKLIQEVNQMTEKKEKVVKEKKPKAEKKPAVKSKAQTVREFLAKGKSHDDIVKETGISLAYINAVISYQDKKKK
jgi:predicted Rossmann fold nucleotide-binding protein DprA/Smf involved in DNA uptake